VAGIVFSFVDGQLFKMTIGYDRSRTQGLTKGDMIASLTTMYGPPSPLPAPGARYSAQDGIDTPAILASWREGDTIITLQQSVYRDSFGLVIASSSLEAMARKAQATAVTMDVREAPAREAAREKAEAEAAVAAAEKTRSSNKATFQP
jgi:hypothetical protein